jgi:hypothetical protein
MGRKPAGERGLTGAERQALYRMRRGLGRPPEAEAITNQAGGPRDGKQRNPTRPQRWYAASRELFVVQAEYAAWLDALPEALRDTPTGEALQAIVDLDLEEIATIQLPRGFGRD